MTTTSHTAGIGSWAHVHRALLAVLSAVAVVVIAGATMLAIYLTRDTSPTVSTPHFPGPSTPTQYCSNVPEPVPC